MKLLTYDEYYSLAYEAYQRVVTSLTKGRGNKSFGEPGGFMGNAARNQCVVDLRAAEQTELAAVKAARAEELKNLCTPLVTEYHIELTAKYALEYKCGNCEEFSALTFRILKVNGVTPLDWFRQEGWTGSYGNHAFVIVGRDSSTTATDISTWNNEVVWCDPYEKRMGGLNDIRDRFKGEKLHLRYRWP